MIFVAVYEPYYNLNNTIKQEIRLAYQGYRIIEPIHPGPRRGYVEVTRFGL